MYNKYKKFCEMVGEKYNKTLNKFFKKMWDSSSSNLDEAIASITLDVDVAEILKDPLDNYFVRGFVEEDMLNKESNKVVDRLKNRSYIGAKMENYYQIYKAIKNNPQNWNVLKHNKSVKEMLKGVDVKKDIVGKDKKGKKEEKQDNFGLFRESMEEVVDVYDLALRLKIAGHEEESKKLLSTINNWGKNIVKMEEYFSDEMSLLDDDRFNIEDMKHFEALISDCVKNFERLSHEFHAATTKYQIQYNGVDLEKQNNSAKAEVEKLIKKEMEAKIAMLEGNLKTEKKQEPKKNEDEFEIDISGLLPDHMDDEFDKDSSNKGEPGGE